MARPGIFPGWRMVAVAFFVDFVAVGFFFYSYGVFFNALAEEFGGSRLNVSIGITLTNIVGALVAPLIGRALDRFPIRRVIAFGTSCMALGFFGLSQVATQFQFYLVLAIFIGVGAGSMGQLATAKLVSNWFEKRRGTALGIAATGISLSGVIMPGLSAWVISVAGWRGGFMVYAAFTALVVLPVVLRWVISRPEDLGLRPDGRHVAPGEPAEEPRRQRIWASGAVLREPQFWFTAITLSLLFCCMSATLTHMVPRVTDMGYSLLEAAPVLSLCAALGVVGKLLFGWLADRWTGRRALLTAIACQFTGQLGMLASASWLVPVWGGPSWWGMAGGAMVFGLGMGGVVPLHSSIVSAGFGRDAFGRVMGMMRPAMLPIQVLGIPFAGYVFDVTGNYDIAFQTFLGIYVLAVIAALQLKARDDDPLPLAAVAQAGSKAAAA